MKKLLICLSISMQMIGSVAFYGCGKRHHNHDTGAENGDQPNPGTDAQLPGDAELSGLPSDPSSIPTLNVSVTGSNIENYAYVITTQLDCPSDVPDTFFPISTPITDKLTNSGQYTLCVWGRSRVQVIQNKPTRHSWTLKLNGPSLSSALPTMMNPADATNGKVHLTLSASVSDSALLSAQISIGLKGIANGCLNGGKTAFDHACPNYISLTPAATMTTDINSSLLTNGKSYTVTWIVSDAAGNKTTLTKSFIWRGIVSLYLGIQDSGGTGARVEKFTFNIGNNAVTRGTPIDVSAQISTDDLRAFAESPDGSLIVGGGSSLNTAIISTSDAVSAGPTFSGGAPSLTNVHGLCVLPNGHFIAGHYTNDKVLEFDSSGTYVRDVYSLQIGSLSDCVAKSNTEVYLVDYDANGDSDADVVRVVQTAGTWNVSEKFDLSSKVGNSSSIYSIALHSNGDLYAPPQNPDGSRNRSMIRCAGGKLTACSVLSSIRVVSSADGFLQGIAQLPGSDDFLLVTQNSLKRYDIATGNVTVIYDLSTLPDVSQIRHIRIR